MGLSVLLLGCVFGLALCAEYRPTVLMHGLWTSKEAMSHIQGFIKEDYPTLYTHNVEIGDGKLDSMFMDINKQIEQFAQHVQSDPKLAKGFNLIGHSQGGLITRAYIERYNDPPVYNYISLAGPHDGQYGVPDLNALCPDEYCPWLANLFDEVMNGGWVSKATQEHVAFASYWKDPFNYTTYLEKNIFLADINNEKKVKNETYKKNMLSLNSVLLMDAKKDAIVIPKTSPWFYFYPINSTKSVTPFKKTEQYTEDLLGLKTLDLAGKLTFYTADCTHANLPRKKCKTQVYDDNIRHLVNNTLP